MIVYLLRHGKAGRRDPDKPRTLTPQGKAEVAGMAGHFKRTGLQVDALWHSPKTRAVETAMIFLKILGDPSIAVEEKAGLLPDGDALGLYLEINRRKGGNLLVVTHLPLVEELAALLSNGSPDAPALSFPTAGAAAFEGKNETWKWLWSLDPGKLG